MIDMGLVTIAGLPRSGAGGTQGEKEVGYRHLLIGTKLKVTVETRAGEAPKVMKVVEEHFEPFDAVMLTNKDTSKSWHAFEIGDKVRIIRTEDRPERADGVAFIAQGKGFTQVIYASDFRIADADPYLELKQAWALGKTIQTNFREGGWSDWDKAAHAPKWTNPPEEYRIKPEEDKVVDAVVKERYYAIGNDDHNFVDGEEVFLASPHGSQDVFWTFRNAYGLVQYLMTKDFQVRV